MLKYLLTFLFHISFRKFFKFDLRPKLIKYFHSYKFDTTALFNEGIISNDIFDYCNTNFLKSDFCGEDKRAFWENHRLDIINREEIDFQTRLGILLFG